MHDEYAGCLPQYPAGLPESRQEKPRDANTQGNNDTPEPPALGCGATVSEIIGEQIGIIHLEKPLQPGTCHGTILQPAGSPV